MVVYGRFLYAGKKKTVSDKQNKKHKFWIKYFVKIKHPKIVTHEYKNRPMETYRFVRGFILRGRTVVLSRKVNMNLTIVVLRLRWNTFTLNILLTYKYIKKTMPLTSIVIWPEPKIFDSSSNLVVNEGNQKTSHFIATRIFF